jgi:hypothetical protein
MFSPTFVETYGTGHGEAAGDMLTGCITMIVGRQTWSQSIQPWVDHVWCT